MRGDKGKPHKRLDAWKKATARGSLSELDTHLEIAVRLGYLASEVKERLQAACDHVDRLLNGLIRSLNSRHL